jgi:hypothetical protein
MVTEAAKLAETIVGQGEHGSMQSTPTGCKICNTGKDAIHLYSPPRIEAGIGGKY